MKLFSTFLFLVLVCIGAGCQSTQSASSESIVYLDQLPPGKQPTLFAEGLISKAGEYEYGSVFSQDGKEFFYGVDLGGRAEIRSAKLDENSRLKTQVVLSHEIYSFNDPFLSPDGNELFYISNRPLNGNGAKKDYDIWYSTRGEGGWSDPVNAGLNINSSRDEYYISFTHQGSMYFASNVNAEKGNKDNFDIYKTNRLNGVFQPAERLSDAVNTDEYEADVFVSPDESFMIFSGKRSDGLGHGDLYFSFKNEDDEWMDAKNMGSVVNSDGHELCPFVTADGKYFFYTSNKDIYWVDANILERYRR